MTPKEKLEEIRKLATYIDGTINPHVAWLIARVEQLETVMRILIDDADFFTGDIRKMTAWSRVLSALHTEEK